MLNTMEKVETVEKVENVDKVDTVEQVGTPGKSFKGEYVPLAHSCYKLHLPQGATRYKMYRTSMVQ